MVAASLLPVLPLLLAAGAAAQQHPFVGRVLTAEGDAVAGGVVTARWCAAPELPGLVGWTLGPPDALGCSQAVTQTDAAGRFRLQLPVAGPVALVARETAADQQSLRYFPVMAGSNTELRLRPTDWLAGVVEDEQGNAMSGFPLLLEPRREAWLCRTVTAMPLRLVRITADAAGRFRHAIEHAWPMAMAEEPAIELAPADLMLGFERPVFVRPSAPFAALELRCSSRRLLRGSLQDLMGRRVPVGGRIQEEQAPWRAVGVGADGTFAFPMRDTSRLVGLGKGLAADLVAKRRGPFPDGVVAKLLPARRLVARLLDELGSPLAERDVLWSTARGDEPPLECTTRSDANGRVVFEDAPPLTTASGFVRVDGSWRRFVRLGISRDDELGDLTVRWRSLDGQLLDAQGVPMPGARVVACEADPIGPLPPCWIIYANHGGRFHFPSLPRRAFTVLVDAGEYGLARSPVGADDTTCAVRLEAGPPYEVTVLDDDGNAAAGAFVVLRGGGGVRDLEAPSPSLTTTSRIGITDSAGIVRFRGLSEHQWRLEAFWRHAGSLQVHRSTVPLPPDAVTVTLRPERR